MANRGMMADNMFVGKVVLLGWLNNALQLRLEKVEDTCTGAVACQLMDCLHPGSVNMKKVDFNVKNDYEFVGNYKELQQAFTKSGVDRAFNVASLSKGKFQDNNEFMQWFKGYWDHVTGGQEVTDYDAISRRQMCRTGDWKKMSLGEAGGRATSDTIPAVRRPGTTLPRSLTTGSGAAKVQVARSTGGSKAAGGPPSRTGSIVSVDTEQYTQQIEELMEQVTELKLKVDTVERERDFYFEKLRDIEVLTQAPELADIPIVKIVEKILYAADGAEAKAAMADASVQYGATFDAAATAEDVAAQ